MADTGWKYPTSFTDFGNWGGSPSYTIDAIQVDGDGKYWYPINPVPTWSDARLKNFGISIPAGNTIDGIEIMMRVIGSDVFNAQVECALSWDNDINRTATKNCTAIFSTPYVTKTLGGPTEKWGRTWTPSELANGSFVVQFRGLWYWTRLQCEYFAVKVYYTAGTAEALSGVIPGTSAVSGDMLKMVFLAGPSNGVSALSGNINSITPTPFAGVISAVSSLPNTPLGNVTEALRGVVPIVSNVGGFVQPKYSVLYVPDHVNQMKNRLIEQFK